MWTVPDSPEDLKAHRTDRDAGKEAMASATANREKEAAAFRAEAPLTLVPSVPATLSVLLYLSCYFS